MRLLLIQGWKQRFMVGWRTIIFLLSPMAVIWLLSIAAWDHFILNVKPDLSWSMLITLPLFFVVVGAAVSAVAAPRVTRGLCHRTHSFRPHHSSQCTCAGARRRAVAYLWSARRRLAARCTSAVFGALQGAWRRTVVCARRRQTRGACRCAF